MEFTLTWGDILVHILLDTLVGIIVSFVFLRFVLYLLQPRVMISPEVAIEKGENEEDPITYWFKVVNLSRWPGFELNFSAEIITLEVAQNGCNHHKYSGAIPLVRHSFSIMPRHENDKKIKKTKSAALHCFQVRTFENLPQIVTNRNQFVVLHVSLKHGLSGLFKSFDQVYTFESRIRHGHFAFGNQLHVI